ncbi:hypothetical protein JL101_027695 [Skermanella rosea]|nr:hypothetical protein [Skermanella rosea]UEM03687.1 hypothetical protein JL101_027695 [Skermanella rosea]
MDAEPMSTTETLVERLRVLRGSMSREDGGWKMPDGLWWVANQPLTNDFNREIAAPGSLDKFPDGAVAVRVDDDFFVVAVLPPEFVGLGIERIVPVLWPDVTDPVFKSDTFATPNQQAPSDR